MRLISVSSLFEASKRRTAYRSGRKEVIGFELPKEAIPRPKRKSPTEKKGRLIARTPFASRQRWRVW